MNNKKNSQLNSDEEIVEQDEIVERDEYYDEEYFDDYDEYDDYYGEEFYDQPPYNPEFDHKIELALREIADIKESLNYSFIDNTPATVAPPQLQGQPLFMQPSFVEPMHMPHGTSIAPDSRGRYIIPYSNIPLNQRGQEIMQYGEMAKLKDELLRANTTLELQKEVVRLREQVKLGDSGKVSKIENAINRLADKIDQMEKRLK